MYIFFPLKNRKKVDTTLIYAVGFLNVKWWKRRNRKRRKKEGAI